MLFIFLLKRKIIIKIIFAVTFTFKLLIAINDIGETPPYTK